MTAGMLAQLVKAADISEKPEPNKTIVFVVRLTWVHRCKKTYFMFFL